MFIRRAIAQRLLALSQQFPAVALLGPRQSGKTTLAKKLFPHHIYFSFEELGTRQLVLADPKAFLAHYQQSPGLILDEIQQVPELLSYMQTHIDTYKKKGHFIITGSQNILVSQAISQSLAGRIALLTLLPLSLYELDSEGLLPHDAHKLLLSGSYPSIYADNVTVYDWYNFYISTYIERDVRSIKNITDLSMFQKFMQLCAGRIGQELNTSSFANDLGLSVPTIKQWLSVLEATYIIFLLQPYHKNFNKRLIKSPKLYFYDTGIAAALLGITTEAQLFAHYLRGGLFESLIIADLKKQFYNAGLPPSCYFWRDQSGYEVDCIIELNQQLMPIEIKASSTYNTNFLTTLVHWNAFSGAPMGNNRVIYGGDVSIPGERGTILGWRQAGTIIQKLAS